MTAEQQREWRIDTKTRLEALIQGAFWKINVQNQKIEAIDRRIEDLKKQRTKLEKERQISERLLREYQYGLESCESSY